MHQSVSNDGATVPEVASDVQGEEGSEGTGKQPLAGGEALMEESATEVWDLLELEPATGGLGQEVIIGADNRVLVNPTTSYPARAVALVTFQGGRCTGWFYGPDIVATAGHCVHSGGSGGSWRQQVRVFPGRNGRTSPYGSCRARRLYSVRGWTVNRNEQYDYGAIKLDCKIGNEVGWFGYWWQSARLRPTPTQINGYPGDKPLTQWRSNDRVRTDSTRQVFYLNDTLGGMSGSPVFTVRGAGSRFCVGTCSMAIHAYGTHGSGAHRRYNHGTRITRSVFDNMRAWKMAP